MVRDARAVGMEADGMKTFKAMDDVELKALLDETTGLRGKAASALVRAEADGDADKIAAARRALRAIDRKHKAIHHELNRRLVERIRRRRAGEFVPSPFRRNLDVADSGASDWGCDLTGNVTYNPRPAWATDYNY